MTCDAFEVVVVPFPAEGHTVMAMITDARNPPWPLDIRIDHQPAGLKMPSRPKLQDFRVIGRQDNPIPLPHADQRANGELLSS